MSIIEDLEPKVPQEEIDAGAPAQTETPKAEEPKAEEPKAEEGEVVQPARQDKFVKIQALDEQKHKRRAAEAERDAAIKRAAILEDRWNQLLSAQQPKQQAPDFAVDPANNLDARLRSQQQTIEQLAQYATQVQQAEQLRQQQEAFRTQVSSLEAEFAEEAQDYPQALDFVRNRRIAELQAAGYEPAQIGAIVQRDAAQIAWDAMQRGKNPAQVIYDMAVNTGYKSAPAAGKEKIETIKKGVEASKSLKNSSGDTGWPSPAQIAEMSESDFAELKSKLKKKGMDLSDVL